MTGYQQGLFDDPEERKAQGMAFALGAVPDWRERALGAMLAIGRARGRFTSEDVTDLVGLPRFQIGTNQNNAVGAAISGWARDGLIVAVGTRKSQHAWANAAEIRIWELTPAGAVLAQKRWEEG